jgi:TonB family protein
VRWGAGVFSFALAASFGVHALLAAGIPKLDRANASAPVVIDAGATRIVLEQNTPTAKPAPPVAAPPQRLVVTHNVVQIARAPVPAAAAPALPSTDTKPRDLLAVTVHPQQAPPAKQHDDVPVWRRDDTSWRTVARTTTTSVTETAPQTFTHNAEAIELAANYPTREVGVVGGETAINPQPPMIAYEEGANGTTVFEVLVDERGTPTKCVITKSAGYPVLDETVCKAAMKARYTPKIVEGRAVPGVYRDAFTFHMSDDTSDVEGIPQQTIGTVPVTIHQPRTPLKPNP